MYVCKKDQGWHYATPIPKEQVVRRGLPRDVEILTVRSDREGRVRDAHRGVIAEVLGEIVLHTENIDRLQTELARRLDVGVQRLPVTRESRRHTEILLRQARDDIADGRGVAEVAGGDNDSGSGLHLLFFLIAEDLRIETPSLGDSYNVPQDSIRTSPVIQFSSTIFRRNGAVVAIRELAIKHGSQFGITGSIVNNGISKDGSHILKL